MRGRPLVAVAGLTLAGLTGLTALAGCSTDPNSVAGQAQQGSDKNYLSQDGGIEHVAVKDRKAAVALSGTTLDGAAWSVADAKGRYVVLNVWGSWCPPCTAEQPDLEAAWKQLQAEKAPVTFMGVDIRDSVENAKAFVSAKGVTYPSLRDDGTTVAALQGAVSSPPVTLVLDKDGRIAGRISGRTTKTTLLDLVHDVMKDGA